MGVGEGVDGGEVEEGEGGVGEVVIFLGWFLEVIGGIVCFVRW